MPCQTCKDRQHSELCKYEPPPKRIDLGTLRRTSSSTSGISNPAGISYDNLLRKLENIQGSLLDLTQEVRALALASGEHSSGLVQNDGLSGDKAAQSDDNTEDEDVYARNDTTGETVHFGANSVLATAIALQKDATEVAKQHFPELDPLPLLRLDNQSATYPFVDLGVMAHGPLTRIGELSKLLPTDAEVLQYFRQYRDLAYILYPAIVDIAEFETDLMVFLAGREAITRTDDPLELSEHNFYGASLHWVGLLFAVLASGCQCTNMAIRERRVTSQIFGKRSTWQWKA